MSGAGAAAGRAYFTSIGGRDTAELISSDPGPRTGATRSSFAGMFADAILQAMGQGR